MLQYADDTLVILQACPTQLDELKSVLQHFSAITGLHINFYKSTFVPMDVEEQAAAQMACSLGCKIESFPQTYLGLPLSASKLKLADMQPLIYRHDRYLSGWAGWLLNRKGRTALIKSTSSALPIYAMCAVSLPKGTLDTLERKDRAFLWTGADTSNGDQGKVAWEVVARPKAKGGLGIKNGHIQNQCLLGKLWHKLFEEPATSWQRWFCRMYGEGASRDLGAPHHMDTPVWKALLAVLPIFRRSTEVHVGDGARAVFWHDRWLGPAPLLELFPALYSHSARPHLSVVAALDDEHWALTLAPRLSPIVADELELLNHALTGATLLLGTPDRRFIHNSRAPYSSKGAYAHRMAIHPTDPLYERIWRTPLSPKCKHFMWLVRRDRLPTRDLLHRRHIADSAMCPFCSNQKLRNTCSCTARPPALSGQRLEQMTFQTNHLSMTSGKPSQLGDRALAPHASSPLSLLCGTSGRAGTV